MLPGKLKKIWTHEGAHLYYARKVHPKAKVIPPSIIVEGARFAPLHSAIDLRGSDKKCDRARLLAFSKCVFAGGLLEAKIEMAKSKKSVKEIVSELGDGDDIRNFDALCEEIRKASPGLEIDNKDIRKEAERAVWADIHDPKISSEMESAIEEVKAIVLASAYPEGDFPTNV